MSDVVASQQRTNTLQIEQLQSKKMINSYFRLGDLSTERSAPIRGGSHSSKLSECVANADQHFIDNNNVAKI